MAAMSLEQVEQLVMQLPARERLKLAARICDALSLASANNLAQDQVEQLTNARIQLANQLMAEVEDIADDSQGEFDAVADIRRMRDNHAWLAECEKVATLWKGEFDSAADLRRVRDEAV